MKRLGELLLPFSSRRRISVALDQKREAQENAAYHGAVQALQQLLKTSYAQALTEAHTDPGQLIELLPPPQDSFHHYWTPAGKGMHHWEKDCNRAYVREIPGQHSLELVAEEQRLDWIKSGRRDMGNKQMAAAEMDHIFLIGKAYKITVDSHTYQPLNMAATPHMDSSQLGGADFATHMLSFAQPVCSRDEQTSVIQAVTRILAPQK